MPTFIDIGSYNGRELKQALSLGWDVHAFEPNPKMKPYLIPYDDRAVINYAAAWNKDGEINLYSMFNPEPGQEGLSVIKEKVNNSKENFVKVPSINIGKYLYELGKDIDILKIDAEGSEYVILESILDNFDPKKIKRWVVEDHSNYINDPEWRIHKQKVLDRMKDIKIEDWTIYKNFYELLE